MAKIEFQNVSKSFGQVKVIENLNLTIEDGKFTVLVGSSGCGKTTLLRMIAGIGPATSGRILMDGKDITDVDPGKRDVAMVFQNYAIYPTMSVRENIEFGLKNRKVPKAERARLIEEYSKIVGLTEYLDRKPSQLSGGQRQRIAIARALAPEPELLLLDEPLGALDLQLRRQMQLELKRLQKKLGITFVYITHDQEEAINMSDRIAVMRGGRFEQLGTPEEIYDEPKTHYVAQFIGRSTILSGRVEAVGKDTAVIRGACGSFTADASRARLSAGEDCEICVRTERMRVSPVPVEGFQLPVTVREARYAGGSVLTYAILPDGEEAVATSEGRLSDALTPGSTAYLYWNPAQAAVIGGTSHGA